MSFSILVAASLNNVIGVQNRLPWHLPADLKYFKTLTTGHTILMGRKTFESIGKPLPNRENIVITHNLNYEKAGIVVKNSIQEAIDYCRDMKEVFVIGGEIIFRQMLPFCNKIYFTRVHTVIEDGDAFFLLPKDADWELESSISYLKDDKNPFDYTYEVYRRTGSNHLLK